MKIIDISCVINDEIINTKGSLDDNIITFDYENSKVEYNLCKNVLTKTSNTSKLYMEFNIMHDICYFCLNDLQLDIKLETKEIIKEANVIIIKYLIENDEFRFFLEYKEVNE